MYDLLIIHVNIMAEEKKQHVVTIDPTKLKEGTCQILDANWGDGRKRAAVCKEGNIIKIYPVEPESG